MKPKRESSSESAKSKIRFNRRLYCSTAIIAAGENANAPYYFATRRWWRAVIKVWLGHPSNSSTVLSRYRPTDDGHTGGHQIVSIRRRGIGLRRYNGWPEKTIFPGNREKEQTSITDLPHPNNPTPVWKALISFSPSCCTWYPRHSSNFTPRRPS